MGCLVTERLCKNPIAMGRCVLMWQFMCMGALFSTRRLKLPWASEPVPTPFQTRCSDIREKGPSRKNTCAPTFRIWFQSLPRGCKMWQVTMVHMDRTFVSEIRRLLAMVIERVNETESNEKSLIYSFHQYGRRLSRQIRKTTENKDIAFRTRHSKNSFIWPIPESVVNGRCACCWLGTNRSTTRNPIQWPFSIM